MGTYKESDEQFLYSFNFMAEEMIKRNNETLYELYNIINLFDGNLFHAIKAYEYFDNSFNEYKLSKEETFKILLDTTYHVNYCIRLLSTLDDIMNKLIVKIYLYHNEEIKFEGQKAWDYTNFYKNTIKKDKHNELELPNINTINKFTVNDRHIFTHEGVNLIVDPVIEEDGMTKWYGINAKVIKTKQVDLLEQYKSDINKDINNIKYSVQKCKSILFPMFDEEEKKVIR
ncbi:hypothetical protein [Mammaliicoccus sp. H-M34]|uniref:hypothetical protein n=1 Tax=Mammaliicoccus sp. H-M34 TaxID=2898693 RepID=UPI001EFC26B9|nr:hypothetical protein [Mammaliicoccus sp. H-M34]